MGDDFRHEVFIELREVGERAIVDVDPATTTLDRHVALGEIDDAAHDLWTVDERPDLDGVDDFCNTSPASWRPDIAIGAESFSIGMATSSWSARCSTTLRSLKVTRSASSVYGRWNRSTTVLRHLCGRPRPDRTRAKRQMFRHGCHPVWRGIAGGARADWTSRDACSVHFTIRRMWSVGAVGKIGSDRPIGYNPVRHRDGATAARVGADALLITLVFIAIRMRPKSRRSEVSMNHKCTRSSLFG